MRFALISMVAFTVAANAQTTTTPVRTITAVGSASISAKPDKAMVDIGVSTQATTATDADTQNATQASSVIAAMQTVLGANADIKTVSYSLNPVYSTGTNPSIIGYMASNIVEATVDLTNPAASIGKLIDVSIGAGANRVNGIRFGLQNPDPIQGQALKDAAAAALAQAKLIASGLGVQTGTVLRASQGTATVFTPNVTGVASAAPTTPVEPGLIQVQGSVTVEVSIQ